MQIITIAAILAIAIPMTSATIHSMCFDYFLKEKDGCITAANDIRYRCPNKLPAPPKPGRAHAVTMHKSKDGNKTDKNLQKRYDSTKPVFYVSPGDGICKKYTDDEPGACLWSGPANAKEPTLHNAGWLNSQKTSNCGKTIWVNRQKSHEKPIYVPIVDGCAFDANVTSDGCFRIGLTLASFKAMKPTDEENQSGTLKNINWDFNVGQGPV